MTPASRAEAVRMVRRSAQVAGLRSGALDLLPLATTLVALALLALVLWARAMPVAATPSPAVVAPQRATIELLTMPPAVAGARADRAAAILLLTQRAADSLRAAAGMAPGARLAVPLVVRMRPRFPAAMLGETMQAARAAGFPRVELELTRE